MLQTVEKAADERWTRRLALDDRQLREGMVLRGNQARARRFVQVCAAAAIATGCGQASSSNNPTQQRLPLCPHALADRLKPETLVCCAETAEWRGSQRR